jgi:protein-disulfide isomerase
MMDDIGETEVREEYITMVSQIFDSEEQGYEQYNNYAKEKKCSMSDWMIKFMLLAPKN